MARGLRGAKGETNSIEDAVPAVFRDPGWGGGEGGSGHVLVDVVDESSAETSAEKLSLGPRESGVVSTGRSAVCSEILEVKVGAVSPRGWRTPADVRERNRRVVVGEDSGVGGPGKEAVVPGKE